MLKGILAKGVKPFLFRQSRMFSKVQIKLGTIGESVTEATVKTFNKKIGEAVNVDDVVIVVESDKGEAPVRSTHSGVITKYLYNEGDDVTIGADIFELDTEGKASAAPSQPKAEAPKQESKPAPEAAKPAPTETKAAPKAQPAPTPKAAPAASSGASKDTIQFTEPVYQREETREKMSRMRKTVAKRLKESQNTYASITTFQEIDMGAVMDIRKDLGAEWAKKNGLKLGFMSFFLKACARALVERPVVNALMDIDNGEIIYRNFVDISVAVQSPKGLVVPVMRDVQKMSFFDCENVAFLSTRLSRLLLRKPETIDSSSRR